ncbi:MAG: hypothetical protein IPL50_08135 [Chitinophagaceae bacterium]|nr:hypothetical protein [Chitinophagaceae bacterium]
MSYFVSQSAFYMDKQQQPLDDLQHIKQMMERSSRFISLSGLSGIAAGICALAGAWFASQKINCWVTGDCQLSLLINSAGDALINDLFWIATLTFVGAFVSAFVFTYLRSRKNGTPIWGATTMRLFWNMVIPLGVGAIFLIRMMQMGEFQLVAPGCLIFYGLALVNASKYTLSEVRFFIGRKTNTTYSITRSGEKEFKAHLDALTKMIGSVK